MDEGLRYVLGIACVAIIYFVARHAPQYASEIKKISGLLQEISRNIREIRERKVR